MLESVARSDTPVRASVTMMHLHLQLPEKDGNLP